MTSLKGIAMFEYKFKDYPERNFSRIGFKPTQAQQKRKFFSA